MGLEFIIFILNLIKIMDLFLQNLIHFKGNLLMKNLIFFRLIISHIIMCLNLNLNYFVTNGFFYQFMEFIRYNFFIRCVL